MSQATHGWMTGEQQKFISRIGNWFRKGHGPQEQPPANGEDGGPPMLSGGNDGNDLEPRHTLLRPWARRDQALDNLHSGISALSDLLVSLRESMEKQCDRQDQLLGYLASLPEAMRAIPEAGRIQGEAFKAIQGEIERQTTQQSRLCEVLDRLSTADDRQGSTLEAMRQTVSALNDHDQAISHNLQSLGVALQSMTGNSQTSAEVLSQLRDNAARRDGELENVIKRQNTRFTTLLSVAIVLSVAALTTVSAFGYLAYEALSKAK